MAPAYGVVAAAAAVGETSRGAAACGSTQQAREPCAAMISPPTAINRRKKVEALRRRDELVPKGGMRSENDEAEQVPR